MKIVVLLGGDSAERKVSIASGTGIVEALRRRGHETVPIDPALPLEDQAEPDRIVIGEEPPADIPSLPAGLIFDWLHAPAIIDADCVFVALHGGAGEDGTVQAMLEAAGIPYTGTGVLGSALAMNKDRSKALFREAGIRTAHHLLLEGDVTDDADRARSMIEDGIGFPAVVKPNCQGSSVGFSYLQDAGGLAAALRCAAGFGGGVIVECYIAGREVTAAVLEGEALPLVEIIPDGGFYDYKRKYTKGTSRYEVPAHIDRGLTARIQREAVRAYRALTCRDYARVDFRLGDDGEPYCLEVNTLPGMTELSLVPMAAGEAGIGFDELVERICLMACARRTRFKQGAGYGSS
ncbi:MAG TPA: D-alanine--D-alanine ligase [Patescibacteria group bacterium]|nr:D-alanine--D-alanine ligase [Patescibacteria group bacterium]